MTAADWIFQIIGTIGVIIGLSAYFLLQAEKLRSDQLLFPTLNLIGATLIAVSLLWHWNFAAFLLEAAWMSISIYGIVRLIRKTRKRNENGR